MGWRCCWLALQDWPDQRVHLRQVHNPPPAGRQREAEGKGVGRQRSSGAPIASSNSRRQPRPAGTDISQQQMTVLATRVWFSLRQEQQRR